MATFARQPFASTHPAIDALWQREFTQDDAATKAGIANRQIDAQSELAQAQLRQAYAQQDYANLFREREFNARRDAEKVRQAQADRYLKLYEGQVPNQETERIRQINAAAKAAAARFKAAYDTALESEVITEKEKDRKSLWLNGLWPGSMKELEDSWNNPAYPKRVEVERRTFQNTLRSLQKDPELRLVVPDPNTRTFMPAQLDDKGNLIPFDLGTNAPPRSPGATNNPAALGTTGATTGVSASGASPSGSSLIAGGLFGPLYTSNDALKAEAANRVIGPVVSKGFGALADLFKIQPPGTATIPATPELETAPAPPGTNVVSQPTTTTTSPTGVPSVKQSYGSVVYLLTPEDSVTLRRILDETPADQQPRIFKQMMDYLRSSGRAVPSGEGNGITPPTHFNPAPFGSTGLLQYGYPIEPPDRPSFYPGYLAYP